MQLGFFNALLELDDDTHRLRGFLLLYGFDLRLFLLGTDRRPNGSALPEQGKGDLLPNATFSTWRRFITVARVFQTRLQTLHQAVSLGQVSRQSRLLFFASLFKPAIVLLSGLFANVATFAESKALL